MKISELDKILKDVRDRNIRTMEARVKILELIENLEVYEAVDLVKKLTLTDVVKSSCGWTCEKCGETVNGIEVTFEEKHDGCGGNCI